MSVVTGNNNGLSDSMQAILMFVATSLITINVYLATVPDVPKFLIVIFGALSALAVVAKETFGDKKRTDNSNITSSQNTTTKTQ